MIIGHRLTSTSVLFRILEATPCPTTSVFLFQCQLWSKNRKCESSLPTTTITAIPMEPPCTTSVFLFQCQLWSKNRKCESSLPTTTITAIPMEPPTERPLAAFDATVTLWPEQKLDFCWGSSYMSEFQTEASKTETNRSTSNQSASRWTPPKQKHQ